ncbi:glycosyltransferase, partial [Providencia rettgeri]|nr:glycosyltransferase [Providencia rettgeri]
IYNGVDPKKFTPYNSTSKLKFTNNNNLSISREKVLFCGHLSDLKDPLIVANCSTHFPQLDFIFLGSGPLEEKLNMIAENNTNIFIMGKVNNVNEFLSIADYFIMPSHTEGMPMALIEALLCNLPAICSDIPIFKEVSNLDQFNIELFEVKNNKDLIRAISSMIQKNKIHTKNREIALNYFTSSIMYKKYLEIFNE